MKKNSDRDRVFDCIIVGAGPGGLQAAIYLGRYNMDVLLLDRSGGRTRHAKRIENFLSHRAISGREIIETGIEQAKSFNVTIEKKTVTTVLKKEGAFEVAAGDGRYRSKFVVVSSGVYDNLPPIDNLHRFLGTYFFTCIDCDGYKLTGKKTVVIGNSPRTADLAFAIRTMFTRDVALILYTGQIPPGYAEELEEEKILLVVGRPARIIGDGRVEAVEMKDGRRIDCEMVMSGFGYKLNDGFLSGLDLQRGATGRKFVVSRSYESSLSGLFIVGPLNTGNDQAVIAAGEGAVAAIEIKKRYIERLDPGGDRS